ncbi:MAG: hypothetical protein EXR27_20235 [Betaproteobacteria bacterium]|nr:hypothetical protein [Betaproteobacteria bacterium]
MNPPRYKEINSCYDRNSAQIGKKEYKIKFDGQLPKIYDGDLVTFTGVILNFSTPIVEYEMNVDAKMVTVKAGNKEISSQPAQTAKRSKNDADNTCRLAVGGPDDGALNRAMYNRCMKEQGF